MVPISLTGLNGDEGWILAEPIRNSTGSVLCSSNKVLDKNTIEQLKKHFSKSNEPLNKITIHARFNPETLTKEQQELMKNIQEQNCDIQSYIGEELHDSTLDALKKTYLASEKNMADTLNVVEGCITDITNRVQSNSEFNYSLGQYKNPLTTDVFEHSIRVAQFAVTLANIYNHNLNSHEGYINLKSIGTAALLHDYGTCFKNPNEMNKLSLFQLGDTFLNSYPSIPKNLLQLPYDERYRTVYSYAALKNYLDNSTLSMILLSSESENGKVGLNIKKERMDATIVGSKIIFLCNLYDSLLHNAIKEDQSLENVHSLLEELAENGAINKELASLFLDNIPLYSIGVRVLLSTGEYATVIRRFNGKHSYSPIVKTLVNPPLKPRIIDLRTTTTITISKIVGSNDLLSDTINDITHNQLKTMNIITIPFESPHSNISNAIFEEEEQRKIM